ncbi:MAG: Lrp/AsnC family transcriptional regulator [Thermomicrobiales bacterium]
MSLDDTDLNILELLQEDGRRPNADIARHLKIAESTVRKRIDRMLQAGMFRTVIIPDFAAVGLKGHFIVGVHTELGKASKIAKKLRGLNEVRFVALTTGAFDLVVELFLPTIDDFLTFVDNELAIIEGIKSVETSTILDHPKSAYNWIEMLRVDRYRKEPLSHSDESTGS